MVERTPKKAPALTQAILHHWRESVPDDRLAHLIKDASRGLGRALQMRLAEHSVSFGHWTFLRILWNRDGITQRALSEQAGVMEPTTFSALRMMEKLGYVERRQKPGDRKQVFIHLTPEGRALRDKLVPQAEEVNRIAVSGLAEEEIAVMRKALLAMIDNLAQDEARAAEDHRRIPSTRELSDRLRRVAGDA
ncbi:MAG: MarR family transcriptional regulator [Beijerinckiaceae bacterium]|nr:MarR family transcriptional regulator [Beijerinckiaceae bacterium]MDO9440202.1 MarR family transcriptional regulator [Beijerinckiaceae bacterium]